MLAPSHAHGQCPLDCRRCHGESSLATTSSTDVATGTRSQTLSPQATIQKVLGIDTAFAVPLKEKQAVCSYPSSYSKSSEVEKSSSYKITGQTKAIDCTKRKSTTTFTITSDSENSLAKAGSLLAGLAEVRRNLVPVHCDMKVSQSEANSVWSATWSESQKAWFCILNTEPIVDNTDELNQIVPMIMHDVKSPLSTIQLCLEIVASLTDKHDDEQLARAVARARANAERVQKLADEVLLMEKIKSDTISLDMRSVTLQTVVLDCADTLTALAEEHNVNIEAENMDTVVFADRLRLSQILQNLLSNAIRFSPRGSTVRISSEPCVVDGQEFIRISVQDRGPGIPESMIGEIFQAFRQAAIGKSRSISYGLGLAICDRLVALQGGRIWVESDADSGCTFHVELPR